MVLGGAALGAAWFIRQTQGAALFEVYQQVTRPFQIGPTTEERLTNARVLELQERLVELENQNQKLQELLDYVKTRKEQGITAPIVGRGADQWWQQVTLGRGSQDGIKVGYIVMGSGGLVGRITSTTAHTSRVLLVSDPSSKVGVVISRTRQLGFLQGKRSNQGSLQFFEKVPNVSKGDVVATSEDSRLYPSGLPVGRVQSVNLDKSPAPEAIVELTSPVGYLEWVAVYPFQPISQ